MLTVIAILLALFVLPTPWGVMAVVGAVLVDTTETVLLLRWNGRRRAAVGVETLVGRTATAVDVLAPEGSVRIDGELWSARGSERAEPGAEVVVVAVDGLVLEVRPLRRPPMAG